ncbi:zinc finger protein with KRAB and SCAN domains 8-like isoform X3 [Sebastes umbrosus]|uniref:zinc finger protein with KRAB and SCAN domains 8-like isoform X3 n=1 Tax=Sebastes umbrosus TaxID=72105 RepID=UPI0018A04A52|nr:zinc finger protein with KRAB and SCAN domains 8-like isoform X3 [Sebastes umbrosus]
MSSVEYLREFVNERLTAAAEEIFRVFNKTIIEYEEEIDRQRKLLDIVLNPEIKLHRIELPQQHVCKEEEVLADQQLCIQEWNSSLDQEDPEPPQIKEEQKELCVSQEGEQLVLKQETETFMLTLTDEESDHSEDQTLDLRFDESRSVVEEKPLSYISVISAVVSEPNSDHQLLSHNSHIESQDQRGGKNRDSGSTRNAEPKLKKRHNKSTSHSNNVNNSNLHKIHRNTHTGKQCFKCDTCGKAFQFESYLYRHLKIHTGEKPYSCKMCGKDFRYNSVLLCHIRTHTGEKLYSCNTCGKRYCRTNDLKTHIRSHTGEKPYMCKTCGKYFRSHSYLMGHMKTHTGEKPYSCNTCGKDFRRNNGLLVHIRRAHTGEKPYLCKICGERCFDSSHLAKHIRSHTSS